VFSLKDKVVLVTGAASGIGAAIADTLTQPGDGMGCRLERDRRWVCCAADQRKVPATGRHQRTGLPASGLASRTARCLGQRGGIGHVGMIEKTAAADLDRLYSVNVRGVFNCCKAFVPHMLEQRRGSVINMASIGGIVAIHERLAYTTTKFAVVGLTKALALDHSNTGVRFNCICPCRVETPFVLARLKEYPDSQSAYREMASTQLNGRMARPDEIAAAALYLAADESAMVTGSSLIIDGGWSAGK